MRKLAEGLEDLRTAEGTPLPQNTLSELRRHLARLRFVRDQIRAIEQERLRKLAVAPGEEKPGRDGPPDWPCPWRWYRNSGHAGQRDLLAPLARSQGRRPLRRPYWLARRERQPSTRTGSCARRKHSVAMRQQHREIVLAPSLSSEVILRSRDPITVSMMKEDGGCIIERGTIAGTSAVARPIHGGNP
jgi:hypothetical protein